MAYVELYDDLTGKTLSLDFSGLTSDSGVFIKGPSSKYQFMQVGTKVYLYDGSIISYTDITNLSTVTLSADFGACSFVDQTVAAYSGVTYPSGTYTVTFYDDDQTTVLGTSTVPAGGSATPPSNPSKQSTAQYNYTFAGWNGSYTNVQANTSVYATYTSTVRAYTITWNIRGVTSSESYNYGSTPSHTDPASYTDGGTTYTFTGWQPTISAVTGNKTYTAQYAAQTITHTVTWSVNGTTTTQEYAEGATPSYSGSTSKPSTAQYTYTFTGWSPTIAPVTQDATYTAQYSEAIRSYTVAWTTHSGTETQSYNYGSIPSHATPESYIDGETIYAFTSWSPAITAVTGAQTYEAQYTAVSVETALKTALEVYGKQINLTITKGSTIYTSKDIVSCNISYSGQLLTSVMKEADIELDDVGDNTEDFIGARLGIILSVTSNGATVAKNYGTFIVNQAKYDDANNSMVLTCYDLLLPSMQPYMPVTDFSETVTLGDFLQLICDRIGVTLTTTSFTNSGVEIDGEKYNSQYTYRDVLTEIAQASGGTIAIKNDALSVLYPTASGVTIDASNLKDLTVGDEYGPINSIVIARTPQEDNIYQRDESATSWTEIKIENNQLMDSHREDFIGGIYDALNGLICHPFEITSYGIGCLDICAKFTLQALDGTQYAAIFMSDDIEITQGFTETSSFTIPETTETDYSAADTTDRRLNQTILRVNKQEQTISALVTTTTNKTSELAGQIDQLTRTVSATMTSEQVQILVQAAIDGKDSITTETGYTFDADGLKVHKAGEEMNSRLDNTGLYVDRDTENVLAANNEGVTAINLHARQYLIIGGNSRLEDYQTNRTACFYIGG